MSELPPGAIELSVSELENTFGVLFIGYILAVITYGFTFFQTYIYYSRYPNDHQGIKALVAILSLLDTANSALISHALYYYLIFLFPYTEGLYNATKTYCAEIGLSVLAVYIVQLYYSFRIWTLTKQVHFAGPVAFLSTTAFALGIAMTGNLAKDRAFESLSTSHTKGVVAAGQGCAFLSGLLTFIALCKYSRRAPPSEGKKISHLYDKSVVYMMSRCLLATVIQLGFFITFVSVPQKVFWMPFHLVSSKLFVNSLLSMLNSRDVQYGRGINEEDIASRKGALSFTAGRNNAGMGFSSADLKSGGVDPLRSGTSEGFMQSKVMHEEDGTTHRTDH